MSPRHTHPDDARAAARPRRLGWRPLTAGFALLAAGALAGCGSASRASTVAAVGSAASASASASNTPPAPGSPASAKDAAKLVKYAQCMRSHGVPSFPDPQGGRLLLKVTPSSAGSLNPNSPAFKAASAACKSLAPAGLGSAASASPQTQAQALKFSRCMRAHGVPSFPDPTFSGGGVRIQLHGVDPNSAAFQQAQRTCGSLLPGGAP